MIFSIILFGVVRLQHYSCFVYMTKVFFIKHKSYWWSSLTEVEVWRHFIAQNQFFRCRFAHIVAFTIKTCISHGLVLLFGLWRWLSLLYNFERQWTMIIFCLEFIGVCLVLVYSLILSFIGAPYWQTMNINNSFDSFITYN